VRTQSLAVLVFAVASAFPLGGVDAQERPGNDGESLRHPRWRVPTILDVAQERLAREIARQRARRKTFVPVQPVPVVTDDWVFMRTPRRLIAVDNETGKRRWEYPWRDPAAEDGLSDGSNLELRLWHDAVFADLTVGGGLLLVLDKVPVPNFPRPRGLFVAAGDEPSLPANELVALDIASQGKLAWIAGGEERDDDKTSGMMFLGTGLYRNGKLFTLAVSDNALWVVQLAAERGRRQWRLKIAGLAKGAPAGQAVPLRLGGARPVLIDNLLICPTSLKRIVAVDVEKREVAWEFSYEDPFFQRYPPPPSRRWKPGPWIDNGVYSADGGTVIVTPLDDDNVYALNAATGEKRWQREAGEARLAVVEGNTVLLVGVQQIAGYDATSGEPLWDQRVIELPEEHVVSGRGAFHQGRYLIPTTGKQLLVIDVKAGKIAARVETPDVLGNLRVRGDYLYSQSIEHLSKYRWR
jgi:outer membrane protein assembly factor BamB